MYSVRTHVQYVAEMRILWQNCNMRGKNFQESGIFCTFAPAKLIYIAKDGAHRNTKISDIEKIYITRYTMCRSIFRVVSIPIQRLCSLAMVWHIRYRTI